MTTVNESCLQPVSSFFQQRKPGAIVLLFAVLVIATIGVVLATTYAPVHDFLGTVGGHYTLGGVSLLGLAALVVIFSPLGKKNSESEISETPRSAGVLGGSGAQRDVKTITIGDRKYQPISGDLNWILLPTQGSAAVPSTTPPTKRDRPIDQGIPEVVYTKKLVRSEGNLHFYQITIDRESQGPIICLIRKLDSDDDKYKIVWLKNEKMIESTMNYSHKQIAVMAKYADQPPPGMHLSSLSNLPTYRDATYCIFTQDATGEHFVISDGGLFVKEETRVLVAHNAAIQAQGFVNRNL